MTRPRHMAALLLATSVLTALATPAHSAQPVASPSKVLVVGVPGLMWRDLSPTATPTLWALAERGAIGSLSVRAVGPVTSSLDGWLTLGAGNRASAGWPENRFITRLDPVLESAKRSAQREPFGAKVGALVTALGCPVAVDGMFASVGLGLPASVDPRTACLRVVETRGTTSGQPADMDADVAQVLTAAGDATVLVVGVGDVMPGHAHLHVAIAAGPGFRGGWLRSASTRRTPYVQLIDVAPSVLDILGRKPPSSMVGQPFRAVGGRPNDLSRAIADLVDADVAADAHRRYVPAFFSIIVIAQLLLYGLGLLALRRTAASPRRRRIGRVTWHVALFGASIPAATYLAQLVPWWRHSLPVLLVVVAGWAAVILALSVLGPWRRALLGPPGAVAAVTFIVLAADLLTGAHLQMSSLAGYSPLVAGRFAGVGNVAFAVLGTSALLTAAALCEHVPRRRRLAVVGVIGVVTVAVDGAPLWGSDFGGVLALVPAFGVLATVVHGRQLSAAKVGGLFAMGAAIVTAFALLDYARPADRRTHVGRFVAQLLDGEGWTIVQRKAEANLHLLFHSVLTLLVPLAVVFLALVLLRPAGRLREALERAPALRAGLLGVLVLAVVGFATNDSGVAVPAFALTISVPLALAASLRTAEDADTESPTQDTPVPD